MSLKTYKEFKNKGGIVKPVSPVIIEKPKEQIIEDEILYHLQHPDYPVVMDCMYILEKGIELQIKDGMIITDNKDIKNKLIGNGFHYLGYKKDGVPYV
ncbi:MAG: hypothetical protein MUO85_03785 [candidate division Zixibacteria bacterium]|nr:hypothetical protein [candidate division Zixibacteria bacterium]